MLAVAAAAWLAATDVALAAGYGRLGAPVWAWGVAVAIAVGVLAAGAVIGVGFRRRRKRRDGG